MTNNTNQTIQPNPTPNISNGTLVSSNNSAYNTASNATQIQAERELDSFTNLKTWGIIMAALNLVAIIVTIIATCSDIISKFINATPSSSFETILSLIIPIILGGLYIYAAYLGFTLGKYEKNFNSLKRHIIILSVISIFSLFIFALIGDIFVFTSLLPKYEKEIHSNSSAQIISQNYSSNINPQQPYKKFRSFGIGLIIASAILMLLVVGLGYIFITINMLYFAFGNIAVILPILLIDFMLFAAFIVNIYFIIAGIKMISEKYSSETLHLVLIRVAILSFFWPFFGFIVFGFALAALNKWLPDYKNALRPSNQNQDLQTQPSKMFS